jgi:hypothetical protein
MEVAVTETLGYHHVLEAREVGVEIGILREMDESDIAGFEIDINTHFREPLEVASKTMTDQEDFVGDRSK